MVGQRLMQAASDIFLGWTTDGDRYYYVRQFRDMKGSVDLEALRPPELGQYGGLCGALLARAHSQSPQPAILDAYLGRSDAFDQAITAWSTRYADQVERVEVGVLARVAGERIPPPRRVGVTISGAEMLGTR